MEEEKLLRFLILPIICLGFMLFTIALSASATESLVGHSYLTPPAPFFSDHHASEYHVSNRKWLDELVITSKEQAINSVLEKLRELSGFSKARADDEQLLNEVQNPRATLRIFVSSSMPLELLKAYHREAKKYGGVLVFNGLPQGSFQALIKLIMNISNVNSSSITDADSAARESSSMQIDDEAFRRFGVVSVPCIVLSQEKSWLMDIEEKEPEIYDKVNGKVSINYALSLFADLGTLSAQARELLE